MEVRFVSFLYTLGGIYYSLHRGQHLCLVVIAINTYDNIMLKSISHVIILYLNIQNKFYKTKHSEIYFCDFVIAR